MSVTLNPAPAASAPEAEREGVRPFRWTVGAFYQAIEAGVFDRPERLELIRGEIIEKVAAQRTPHSTATLLTTDVLRTLFEPTHHVRSQMPLDIGRESEPEPDVMVVVGDKRDYEQRQPTPADVRLIVEISDTTLCMDRGSKAALYAEAGVPDYWVLNLRARVLEVRRDPAALPDEPFGYGYRSMTRYEEGREVAPLAAPDQSVRVADLLPRAASDNPTP